MSDSTWATIKAALYNLAGIVGVEVLDYLQAIDLGGSKPWIQGGIALAVYVLKRLIDRPAPVA